METLIIPLLALCALLLVPCVIAASDLHFDLRISVGTAPQPQPAITQPLPPRLASQTSLLPLAYRNQSMQTERELAAYSQTLATIAAGRDPRSALIARNTLRRVEQGDAPAPTLAEFARRRLELIALGDHGAAASSPYA